MEIFPESTCRVCLNEKEILISVYDHVEEFLSNIAEILLICGDLEILKTDNFPKVICEECVQQLFISIKFREKCKLTKNILNQLECNFQYNSSEAEESIQTSENTNCTEKVKVLANVADSFVISEEIIDKHDIAEFAIINEANDSTNTYDSFDIEQTESKANTIIIEDDMSDNSWLNLFTDSNLSNKNRSSNKSHTKNTVYNCSQIQYVVNCKCDVCGAAFTHPENLKKHLYTHDNVIDVEDIVVCIDCSYPFSEKKNLEQHMIEHHTENTEQTDMDDKTEGTAIDNRKNLSKVIILDDNKKEIVSQSNELISNTNAPLNKPMKRYLCHICNRGFAVSSQLQVHMRIHTGERPFKCSKCDKTFVQSGGLQLHERRHENIRPYICSVCKKGFHESSNLKVHMRTHTGERPHKCTVCGKSYSRVFLLQNHLRSHTGERPYKCDVCNKAFIQKSDLVVHKKMHLETRPYICSICGHGFIKRCTLLSHLTSHKKKTGILSEEIIKEESKYNLVLIKSENNIKEFEVDFYESRDDKAISEIEIMDNKQFTEIMDNVIEEM